MTGLRTFYTQQQVFDEPTPRQTDFDSVVVTTWPRPVRLTREESECHFKVCPDIKKPWGWQVSNLRWPRGTDFDSIGVTTGLRPVG
jgi:hypothetical protein